MLSPATLRAVPSVGAILCGIGLAFGDFIAAHALLVFSVIALLAGVFLLLCGAFYKAIIFIKGSSS